MTGRTTLSLMAISLAALASACAHRAKPEIAKLGETVAADSPVSRVADSIFGADRAAQQGKAGAEQLATEARQLALLGAHPHEDTATDLVEQWHRLAIAQGAKQKPAFRGRSLGPAYTSGTLERDRGFDSKQLFLAGKRAEIAVVPSKGAALVLSIADRNGDIVCRTEVDSPKSSCSWLPMFTARYSVALENTGKRTAHYYLVTN